MRCLLWALCMAWLPAAQAHLMAAQRGTLNLVGDGAFIVLSLPVSAFSGVDDDGDGKLSVAELQVHQAEIEEVLRRQMRLSARDADLPLQGLMLQLSPSDQDPAAPADQLVVMGRYALPVAADAADSVRGLRFTLPLYGRTADEQRVIFTVTRGAQRQELLLTPAQPQALLLPRRPSDAAAKAGPALAAAGAVLLAGGAAGWAMRRRRQRGVEHLGPDIPG
jgi:hypothetical protein